MSRETWFKMYPAKYLADTRHMTLEQRGAYMDHICMQMERDGPLPDDMHWLAHQMHISVRKARSIVDELIALKKIKRTPEGLTNEKCEEVIAERQTKAEINAEAARKREAEKRARAQDNGAVKTVFADVSRTVREDFTAEPKLNQRPNNGENSKKGNKNNETQAGLWQKESTTRAPAHAQEDKDKEGKRGMCANAHPAEDQIDDAFEAFWQAFPPKRRRDRMDARKAFVQILTGRHPRKLRATAEQIIAAVKAGRGIDPEEPPMPTTWLNKGRWLDDDPSTQTAPDTRLWWQVPERAQAARDDQPKYGQLIRQHANGIWPLDKLGPPYGERNSLVSKPLAEELGLIGTYDANGMLRPGKKPKFDAHTS